MNPKIQEEIMKKTSLIVLTVALIAALFTGCRRPVPGTTGSTAPATKAPTVTTPTTTAKRPDPIVTVPEPSDLQPEDPNGPSNGNDMGRGRMGPRF